MMNDICEIICTAVDTIVSSKLEGLQYDITKLCTIVDDSQRNKGEYVVSDGSIRFQAFSADTSFRNGNSVLVVIPNGDYNMQKTISGRIAATNTEPFNYTSPMETMVKITGNIFDADDAIVQKGSLLANDITIKNGQEIAGTAIGPLYKITDQTGLSGFTRLGITADFRSWLNGLDVASGTYGLKVYIHANSSINENKTPVVYDLTFTNDDMYGNPYLFEDYFSQEKVFDISSIDEITEIEVYFYQSGNFKDGNGNLIPYMPKDELIKMPNNLFVDNVCIYLGYDVSAFSGETLMLTTNDLTTYTYQEVETTDGGKIMGNPNPVTMSLRWIHKVNDLEYQLLNQEEINTDKYELRWYHYVNNLASSDKYAGIGWELLDGENLSLVHELDKDKQYEEFKVIGIIKQDPTIIENEDGSVTEIENDGLVYTSNILRFTNENYSYSSEIDKNTGLSIVFMDETKGNYYLYNQNGYILNQGLGQGYTRTMKVMYHGAELAQAPDFNINYIIWYMPFEKSNTERFTDQHTMLVASEDYYSENNGEYKNPLTKQWLYTLSKNGTDYVGVKRDFKENDLVLTQSFAIKNQWAQSNANNTVRVIVNINGIDYEASTELKFGKAGTQGTNRTLVLEYASNENAMIAGNGNSAIIEAIMYDYDGTRIGVSDSAFTWGWVNPTNYLSIGQNYGSYIELKCNTNIVPKDNYSILKCTYSPTGEEEGIELTSYLPIAIKDGNYSHIEGAREVIYNHQGVPSYYTDAYILYELDRSKKVPEYAAVKNTIWNIANGEGATGIAQSYIPTLKTIEKAGSKYKALSAAPFYLKDYANKVCVSCIVGNDVVWSQPILIIQSQYDFAMLNEWDGSLTINEENGTILSTMLGAGRKNDDNTFSGVLIGDVKEGTGLYEVETLTGVYGIHEGVSSFALRENGTATFGKAGLGQIHIDGGESTITSQRYLSEGTGLFIDIDDGIIDIKESEKEAARFTLTSKNNTILINVDKDDYYLQSDNYTEGGANGSKLDLTNGYLEIKSPFGKVGISGGYSAGEQTPYFEIATPVGGSTTVGAYDNKLFYLDNDEYYLQSSEYLSVQFITVSGYPTYTHPTDGIVAVALDGNIYRVNGNSLGSQITFSNKIVQVPIYDENGNIDGYENKTVSSEKAKSEYLAKLTPRYSNTLNPKGFKLDMKNSIINGYDLFLKGTKASDSSKYFILDSTASEVPFRIGSGFSVNWDGTLNCYKVNSLVNDGRTDQAISISNNFYVDQAGNAGGGSANFANGNFDGGRFGGSAAKADKADLATKAEYVILGNEGAGQMIAVVTQSTHGGKIAMSERKLGDFVRTETYEAKIAALEQAINQAKDAAESAKKAANVAQGQAANCVTYSVYNNHYHTMLNAQGTPH